VLRRVARLAVERGVAQLFDPAPTFDVIHRACLPARAAATVLRGANRA
jgi:hypothetical protein